MQLIVVLDPYLDRQWHRKGHHRERPWPDFRRLYYQFKRLIMIPLSTRSHFVKQKGFRSSKCVTKTAALPWLLCLPLQTSCLSCKQNTGYILTCQPHNQHILFCTRHNKTHLDCQNQRNPFQTGVIACQLNRLFPVCRPQGPVQDVPNQRKNLM